MSTTVTHHKPADHASQPAAAPKPASPTKAASHTASATHDSVHLSSEASDHLSAHGAHSGATTTSGRAAQIYKPLAHDFGGAHQVDSYERGVQGNKRSYAWPVAQSMNAALDRGDYHEFDKLDKNLQMYRSGSHGYSSASNGRSGTGTKFYDDNAWIGLAQAQAYKQTGNKTYLDQAKSTFDFVKSGEHDGKIPWHVGAKGQQTCSEAPAAELAMQLHGAHGNTPQEDDEYLSFAKRVNDNLDANARQPNGLYRNSVSPGDPHADSKKDRAVCSYNQGAVIGLKTQLYQATGDKKYLQQAQQTANKSVRYLSKNNRFNKQGPGFNAIYFRNLAQLDAVAPNPRYQAATAKYAQGLWTDRNPSTDLVNQTGKTSLLDQAGASQIFSLLAMSPNQYQSLT